MEDKIHKKKISKIIHRDAIIYNIKRCNSPIFKNRINNYLLVNDHKNNNLNKDKKTNESKSSKSTKDFKTNKIHIKKIVKKNKSQENNLKRIKNINTKTPLFSNKNKKIINYIKKKITFQSYSPIISKNSTNHNIIITNYTNKSRIISSRSSSNTNKKNNNCHARIYMTNKPSFSNKNKFFYTSKLSITVDKILSKNINKKHKNNKNTKSFDKSKFFGEKSKNLSKFSTKKINNKRQNTEKKEITKKLFNNKLQNSKINLDKKRKIYKNNRKKNQKIQTQNMTEIISQLNKPNKIQINKNNNTINGKNKNKNIIHKRNINNKIESSTNNNLSKNNKNCLNFSKDNSDLISDDCYNILYDPKILGENHSTNDKTLNNKKESTKKKIFTPNILINKHKDIDRNKINLNSLKDIDNDGFFTYEFDVGNERINKINGVRANNFDVNKPKEENLKFTFLKGEKESDISCSHASKIIIGNIDGYKDIIETDIKNNRNTVSKCFNNLINKKTNIFNNTNKLNGEGVEFSSTGGIKKFSNMSTLLKKESEPVTFNDCILYDSFNVTNNLDNISSTITNNINNEKKRKLNINHNKNDNTFKDVKDVINTSFIINTDNDKTIDNYLKIVNYNIIKGNNLENLNNNCKNKIIKNNNENVDRKSISNNQREKIDNINTNCKIF